MRRAIRPIAIGIVRRGREILVFDAVDPVAGTRFHRPLGGGIEFGERAADAIVRELREESGFDVTVEELLGVVESVFAYEGREHHEICLVFDVRFDDRSAYDESASRSSRSWMAWKSACRRSGSAPSVSTRRSIRTVSRS